MAPDNRRFNGPEDSRPYQTYLRAETYDESYKKLLDPNGRRRDGRKPKEGRAMCKKFFARVDIVSHAKGSAYLELKNTKVICSVFDPREIPHQNEFCQEGELYCEVKFAPFASKGERRSPVPDSEEKALSVALRQALEPAVCRHVFANHQLDIFVYILENDGSCLAAAINAAGLALVNAAVPMFDLVSACSLAWIGDKVFIDPTYDEETLALTSHKDTENHGVITMSTLLQLQKITDFRLVGSLDISCVTESMGLLNKECKEIVLVLQRVTARNVVYNCEHYKKMALEEKAREDLLNTKLSEWISFMKSDK